MVGVSYGVLTTGTKQTFYPGVAAPVSWRAIYVGTGPDGQPAQLDDLDATVHVTLRYDGGLAGPASENSLAQGRAGTIDVSIPTYDTKYTLRFKDYHGTELLGITEFHLNVVDTGGHGSGGITPVTPTPTPSGDGTGAAIAIGAGILALSMLKR